MFGDRAGGRVTGLGSTGNIIIGRDWLPHCRLGDGAVEEDTEATVQAKHSIGLDRLLHAVHNAIVFLGAAWQHAQGHKQVVVGAWEAYQRRVREKGDEGGTKTLSLVVTQRGLKYWLFWVCESSHRNVVRGEKHKKG